LDTTYFCMPNIHSIAVYCASSSKVRDSFFEEAFRLGQCLASEGIRVIYGDGGIGLMGKLAEGARSKNGEVIGVIPRFMVEQGWNNPQSTQTIVVNTMHERKATIEKMADAMIAMPGGIGTCEELMECLTWKQLGLHSKPIILLNVDGFYDPLIAYLHLMVKENMLRDIHLQMFQVVNHANDVIAALQNAPHWDASIRKQAAI